MIGRVAAVVAAAAACGQGGGRPAGAGETAAAALTAAVDRAADERAPWRCATAATTTAAPIVVGARTWTREGDVLAAQPAIRVIVAVADARGAAEPGWRERIGAVDPDLVVTLGGMGETAAGLTASLGAIADRRWLTVAIAGSSEAWPAHRDAVAAVAAAGSPILDGGAAGLLDGGAVVVAMLPGQPYAERLAAGADGCGHDDDDARRVVAAVRARAGDRPTVLVSPRAPQLGAATTAGDPELAELARPLTAVVHAPLEVTASPPGVVDDDGGAAIAAGSLDAVPRFDRAGRAVAPTATAVTVEGTAVRWRPIAMTIP
jgi:hypothetical protein